MTTGVDIDLTRPTPPATPCVSCGAPHARTWSTPDGPARLCATCATLHGLGCP